MEIQERSKILKEIDDENVEDVSIVMGKLGAKIYVIDTAVILRVRKKSRR